MRRCRILQIFLKERIKLKKNTCILFIISIVSFCFIGSIIYVNANHNSKIKVEYHGNFDSNNQIMHDNSEIEIEYFDTPKIKIGYVESEKFDLFSSQLVWMAKAFQEKKILSQYDIDLNERDSKIIWENMCNHCISNRFEFIREMYYSVHNMSADEINSISNDARVNLVIVMGTAAGLHFARNETKNNFMVLASADPIRSGIVSDENIRDRKNIYAHIDRNRYKRQLLAGHKIFKFKKLGVVFEDNLSAFIYSGIKQLQEASETLGFEVVKRHVKESREPNDSDRYYFDLLNAYRELIKEGIDALYITTATINPHKLYWLLSQDIIPNNIVTIAQTSEMFVKYGALIGVTILNTEEQGYFIVKQLSDFANGKPFHKLEQVNDSTPRIYLNYAIAKKINLRIPFSTLLIIDSIKHSIIGE